MRGAKLRNDFLLLQGLAVFFFFLHLFMDLFSLLGDYQPPVCLSALCVYRVIV